MTEHQTTSTDGLHCVYGKCQAAPHFKHDCNPGCYFQMSTLDLCLCGKIRGSCDGCQKMAAAGAEWLRRTSSV